MIFSRLQLAGLDQDAGDKVEARRLILAALELFLAGPLDLNEENEIGEFAQACVLLPSGDPHVRDVVSRTIAILEPLRVKGADPAARLALLSRVRGGNWSRERASSDRVTPGWAGRDKPPPARALAGHRRRERLKRPQAARLARGLLKCIVCDRNRSCHSRRDHHEER